jgi:uncharacterized HAD superfamily protein
VAGEVSVSKPKLGIDLDGCVYPFSIACRMVLNLHRGYSLPVVECEYWNHIENEIDPADWKWVWGAGMRLIYDAAPAYPGAIEALRELEQHVRLVIITARPLDVADLTLRWIADQRIHPYAVLHPRPKSKAVTAPDCIAYVEDRPENVLELADETDGTVLVPRKPWNTSVHNLGRDDVVVFDEWREVTAWVQTAVAT